MKRTKVVVARLPGLVLGRRAFCVKNFYAWVLGDSGVECMRLHYSYRVPAKGCLPGAFKAVRPHLNTWDGPSGTRFTGVPARYSKSYAMQSGTTGRREKKRRSERTATSSPIYFIFYFYFILCHMVEE